MRSNPFFGRVVPARLWPVIAAGLGAGFIGCGGDEPTEPLPQLVRNTPKREWVFRELQQGTASRDAVPWQSRVGGVVDEPHDYGRLALAVDGDTSATGHVYSSAMGETYWVLAEGPSARLSDPLATVGNQVELLQSQSFRKLAPDASLTLSVTGVRLRAINDQGPGILSEACRRDPAVCDLKLQARVDFQVFADTAGAGDDDPGLFWGRSALVLSHTGAGWDWQVAHFAGPVGLWLSSEFTASFEGAGAGLREAEVRLKTPPLTIDVPLDAVRVGQEFSLYIRAIAITFNTLQGETYVSAYFRDPASVSGTTMTFAGLEPTNHPWPLRSLGGAGLAPLCAGGGGEGGVLQFGAGPFRTSELPVPGPRMITVTRTGGSRGRVSARVQASDGSAVVDADYRPLDVIVSWADGDTTSRSVELPIVLDTIAEPDETVNLTLSAVRGCASLGTASAVLTIADDERAPEAPPTFAIGGTVSGLAGRGLVLENVITGERLTPGNGPFAFGRREDDGGSYDIRIVTQPSAPSQACTVANGRGTVAGVDVTGIAVTCTTVAPVAGLDASFGSGGKLYDPEVPAARAVVVQGSGRIVVLADMSLVAYDASGARDPSFGTGGIAPVVFGGGLGDEAYAITRQSDDRLVVVGRTRVGRHYRMAVKRFDADGSPDAGFGTGGLVTVDPYADFTADPRVDAESRSSYAYHAIVAPDGKLLVAGLASYFDGASAEQRVNSAVVRLNPDGTPDASFSGDGATTVDMGGDDWAEAVALQSDGKVLLGGRSEDSRTHTYVGLARVRANGQLDTNEPGEPRLPEHYGRDGSGISVIDPLGTGAGGAHDMLMLAGDRPVVAVSIPKPHATLSSAVQFGLVGPTSDGEVLGSSQVQAVSIGPESDVPRALARQADGKLLLVGLASSATVGDFGVVRFNPDLSLDTSFGTDGVLTVDFFGALDDAAAVAIQPDGRIVVAGAVRNGASTRLGIVRLVP
ncbi:MAG TPA: hypothetical protein VFS08_02730 [Gemmatimonadaceae bacterium]|nr:hypothetical protein [Gemmatimonadaceae bacterium]